MGGDIIGFVDSDDYLASDALAIIKNAFQKDIDILFTSFYYVTAQAATINSLGVNKIINTHKAIEYILCKENLKRFDWEDSAKKYLQALNALIEK